MWSCPGPGNVANYGASPQSAVIVTLLMVPAWPQNAGTVAGATVTSMSKEGTPAPDVALRCTYVARTEEH